MPEEPSPELDVTVAAQVPPGRLAQALARADLKAMLFGAPAESARVGRFAVLRRVGAGGMGVVYAAYDEELDRRVALKLVRPGLHAPAAAARSKREAQALARLSHPNVVQVYEVGEAFGQVYIAMEYVQGETLRAWQERARRPWREVLALYVQAGRGLAAAHARGLVHRDFKPENVLVGDDGRPRVVDFGLARVHGADAGPPEGTGPPGHDRSGMSPGPLDSLAPGLTAPGAVVGTPAYMAPEQHAGGEADARSDVFSFCVALHEALHGARPFPGESPDALLASIEAGVVTRPAEADVPAWLQRVLARGLLADPAARWPTMDALLAALARDPTRWRRRAAIAVAGLVALAAGVLWLLHAQETRRTADLAAEQARVAAAEADLARAQATDEARRLTARSQQLADGDPSLRLLLAVRAVAAQRELGEAPLLEAEQALIDALDTVRSTPFSREGAAVVDAVAESSDGRWLATGERDGHVAVWSTERPQTPVVVLSPAREVSSAEPGPAGPPPAAHLVPDASRETGGGVRATDSSERTGPPPAAHPVPDASGEAGGLGHAAARERPGPAGPPPVAGLAPDASGGPAGVIRATDSRARTGPPPAAHPVPDASGEAGGLGRAAARERPGPASPPPVAGLAPDASGGPAGTSSATTRERTGAASTPAGASRPVRALAFSRDGRWLALARAGEPVHVWARDAGGPEEHALGDIPLADPRDLAWSADGALLVRDGGDAFVLRPDAPPRRLAGGGRLRRAIWSPDGATILTATAEGLLRLWPAAGGAARTLKAPAAARGACGLRSAEWSPDGREIVVACADHTAMIVATGGAPPVRLRGHTDEVYLASFTSGGQQVVTVSRDATARIWERDGSSERVPLELAEEALMGLQLGPDRNLLLGTPAGGEVWLWRLDVRAPPLRLRGHAGSVVAARFTEDGDRILTASVDGRARRWHLGDDPSLLRGHAAGIEQATFLPDGRTVITAGMDGTARVWPRDGRPGTLLGGHREGSTLVLAPSPDGARLLTAGSDGRVRLWSLAALPPVPLVSIPGEPGASLLDARWSPAGDRVALAGDDGRVHLLRLDEGGVSGSAAVVAHAGPVRVVRFTADGTAFASAGDDGRVRVWAASDPPVPQVSFTGHEGPVRALAFTRDGGRLVSAGDDAVARVWTPATPDAPARELRGHLRAISQVGVRPGETGAAGPTVLTASADGTARIWPPDGEPEVLSGHTDALWIAEYGPDGAAILTASADGTARLWRRRGDAYASLLLPQRSAAGPGEPDHTLWAGGFSPDGELVVTAGADGLARVTPVALQGRLLDACARAGRDLTAEEWAEFMGDRPFRPTCPTR